MGRGLDLPRSITDRILNLERSGILPKTSWINATLQNSWVNNSGAAEHTAQYRKDSNGMVSLRGTIKSGTIDTVAFTLPEGFRPKYDFYASLAPMVSDQQVKVGADGTVTIQSTPFSLMPAVTLASWQCSDADTAPRQGWLITTSASLVTLDYTNNIIDPPSLLPPRTGYNREYRMVAALAHFAAVGETAFRFIVEENFSALGVNHVDSTDLIDRPLIALGAWEANAYLDSVAPYPVRVFLRARSEWAGAAGNGTVRAVTIQGRYVANPSTQPIALSGVSFTAEQ